MKLGWRKYKNESRLIADIEYGGDQANFAIEYLYFCYRKEVVQFLLRSNKYLIREDALDIFQDTIVVLNRNIRSGKFRRESNLRTYLKGIARNIAYRTIQKHYLRNQFEVTFEPSTDRVDSPEEVYLSDELAQELELLLDKLPGKGAAILRLWMQRYSMKEIAERMGFKNEQSARNAKKRHLQNIINMVSGNEMLSANLKQFLEH